MSLTPPTKLRAVKDLDAHLPVMKRFLIERVDLWIQHRAGEHFSLSDLIGGIHGDMEETPLRPLLEKQERLNKYGHWATKAAAKEAGWILKATLSEDPRVFEVGGLRFSKAYRLAEVTEEA